jgi:stage V sporulation protein D (sporulation-specific penicillin-binding protein)
MEDALTILQVPPREKQIDRTYKYGETPIVTVPNMIGQSVSDIYEDMNMNFNLSSAGSGNTVIRQAPAAGTRVDKGSTIRIYLGDENDISDTH